MCKCQSILKYAKFIICVAIGVWLFTSSKGSEKWKKGMAIQLHLHVTTPGLKAWVLNYFFCISSLVYQQHFSVDKCLPFLTFQYLKKIISPKQMCECFSFLTFFI